MTSSSEVSRTSHRAVSTLTPRTTLGAYYDPDTFTGECAETDAWLDRYIARLSARRCVDADRARAMNAVNPLFVLRNYVAQLAIDEADTGDPSLILELLDTLRAYTDNPVGNASPRNAPNGPCDPGARCSVVQADGVRAQLLTLTPARPTTRGGIDPAQHSGCHCTPSGLAVDLDRLDEAVVGPPTVRPTGMMPLPNWSMPWWWRLFTSISSPYTA